MKPFEAINWIVNRGVRTGPYSLDRIKYLLEELENPQNEYACVLIGGTNGKGSVTAITESIMANCQDYVSASFTSPHLIDLRERIKILRKPISDKLLCKGVEKLQEICQLMDKEPSIGHAAFFDTITALALWAYREMEIDLAILEVGLGGRYDATNSTSPEISVITNIGTDHQEYLGYGKISIAREKLGIARKKRPLITGEKSPEVIEEFTRYCDQNKVDLVFAKPENHFELLESRPDGHMIKLSVSGDTVFLPLPGTHQIENLATALEVVSYLRKDGFIIEDQAISKGISEVIWPGRLQWVEGNPPVLLDGAHNAEGLDTLVKYLETFPPAAPLNIIFGALKDKPLEEMSTKLKAFGHKLCFVPPTCNRALSREDFSNSIEKDGWQWFETLEKAYDYCKNDAKTILITGSLYLISDALRLLKK